MDREGGHQKARNGWQQAKHVGLYSIDQSSDEEKVNRSRRGRLPSPKQPDSRSGQLAKINTDTQVDSFDDAGRNVLSCRAD